MFNFLGDKKSGPVPARATGSMQRVSIDSANLSPADGEAAMETLGAVLRALGTHAIEVEDQDIESIQRRFCRWAEHVLVAAPLEPNDDGQGRDWTSIKRLTLAHRKREAAYVVKTVTDLREVIWSFVAIVNRSAGQNKKEGVLARERLKSLRGALESNDIEALRREVVETANVIENVLDEQNKRQASQLADFAANVRKLGEELEGAKREGHLDPLTRIHNRACFDQYLERTVGLSALFNRPSTVMMIDIDHFKGVNDRFGHAGGDAVIKAVADCVSRTFPRRDDLVARYGGDEFSVILKEVDAKDARVLAERLVQAARSLKVKHGGRELSVTLSVGFADCRDGDTTAQWLERADKALYQAKANGRNGWAEPPKEISTPVPQASVA